MNKISILKSGTNIVVAQYSGRNYPGVLIQGDSLRILIEELREIGESIAERDFEESNYGVASLISKLTGVQNFYEEALKEKGIDLAY